MALLYEELGDGGNPFSVPSSTPTASGRRQLTLPLPPLRQPPTKWISKSVEEKKLMEGGRSGFQDKWSSLKAYRRARVCVTLVVKMEQGTPMSADNTTAYGAGTSILHAR
jgi:hypothetical protein